MEGGGIGYIRGLIMVFAGVEDIVDRQAQAGFVLPYILLEGGVGVINGAGDILGGQYPASGAEIQFRAPSFFEPELVKEVAGGGEDAFIQVYSIDGAFVDQVAKPAKEIKVPPFRGGEGQVGDHK